MAISDYDQLRADCILLWEVFRTTPTYTRISAHDSRFIDLCILLLPIIRMGLFGISWQELSTSFIHIGAGLNILIFVCITWVMLKEKLYQLAHLLAFIFIFIACTGFEKVSLGTGIIWYLIKLLGTFFSL